MSCFVALSARLVRFRRTILIARLCSDFKGFCKESLAESQRERGRASLCSFYVGSLACMSKSEIDPLVCFQNIPKRSTGVELTPLPIVIGGKIVKYLGNYNFFLIRESTSVKEAGCCLCSCVCPSRCQMNRR